MAQYGFKRMGWILSLKAYFWGSRLSLLLAYQAKINLFTPPPTTCNSSN